MYAIKKAKKTGPDDVELQDAVDEDDEDGGDQGRVNWRDDGEGHIDDDV